jgi:hypothetical protein
MMMKKKKREAGGEKIKNKNDVSYFLICIKKTVVCSSLPDIILKLL